MHTWDEYNELSNMLDPYNLTDILETCMNTDKRDIYDIFDTIVSVYPELSDIEDYDIELFELYLKRLYTVRFDRIELSILNRIDRKIKKRRTESHD